MALIFSGTGRVNIPQWSESGDFDISGTLTFNTAIKICIGDVTDSGSYIATGGGANNKLRVKIASGALLDVGSFTNGQVINYTIARVSNVVTVTANAFTGSATLAGTVNFDALGEYTSNTINYDGTMSGTLTFSGDNNATRTYNTDGSGTTLVDTTSAQNGTLTSGVTFSALATSITPTAIKPATQRNKATSLFTVTAAGTYAGSPTSIERQVSYADGAQEVVLAWAEYIASPSGNTFTGTIELTASTRPYKIEYRFSNDTGVTGTTGSFYGGDYIITCGESLALDMLTDGTGTPSAGVLTVNMSSGAVSSSTAGSGQIANANAIAAVTGVAVFMMNTGVSGLKLLQANGTPYVLGTGSPAAYSDIIDAYNLAGDVAAVNFIIGVNDATQQVSTAAAYKQGFATFFANVRSDTRADLEFLCSTTGVSTGVETGKFQKWTDFIIAQIEAFELDANVYFTSYIGLPLKDTVHLSPEGYAQLGVRLANAAITEIFGGSAPYQPPQITSVSTLPTETTFNLSIPDGSDFTPATSITDVGLSADGFGTALTLVSVERVNATSFKVTHASAAVTDYRYNWGANPTLTGQVKDNSSQALPLLQAQGASVDILSTLTLSITGIPDGTYQTALFSGTTEVFNDTLTYTSGAATTPALSVAVGTALTGYVIDNEATPVDGAVITGNTA